MLVKGHCLVKKLKIEKCKKRIKRKQRWLAVHVCERDASRTSESGRPHFLSHHYQTKKRLINKQNKQNDKKIIDKEVEEEERLNSLSQKVSTQIIRTPLLDSSLSFIETLKLNSHTHSHLSLSLFCSHFRFQWGIQWRGWERSRTRRSRSTATWAWKSTRRRRSARMSPRPRTGGGRSAGSSPPSSSSAPTHVALSTPSPPAPATPPASSSTSAAASFSLTDMSSSPVRRCLTRLILVRKLNSLYVIFISFPVYSVL